jgi:formylglycine-generating enzyme required for sulfatase activity
VIRERTGLLVEAGQGVYRFSHLTFQEYLAAVEVAERDDYVAYTLSHTADSFWREVILLEAGYLSTKNQTKTMQLIKAVADARQEPEPFHNLVLAAECVRDVGATRVEGNLAAGLTQRLQQESERPIPERWTGWTSMLGRVIRTEERRKAMLWRRIAAAIALSRIESGNFGGGSSYWSLPYGEPVWATIPAGEFWMGSSTDDPRAYDDEWPAHRLSLPEFQIACTLITNAQYLLYLQATGVKGPDHWEDAHPPKDKLNHPVEGVSWHEACAYCRWLSQSTGKVIVLPSEAEWEKSARGSQDRRAYPWDDAFDVLKCNSYQLGIEDTTPVGIFPAGASPYNCLDMAGNVWEWTRSLWGEDVATPRFTYPYVLDDGREDVKAPDHIRRVLRGGAFGSNHRHVRCAYRLRGYPYRLVRYVGFRVVVCPAV